MDGEGATGALGSNVAYLSRLGFRVAILLHFMPNLPPPVGRA
jgi:hypothetical protein